MLSATDGFQKDRFLPLPLDKVTTDDSHNMVGKRHNDKAIRIPTQVRYINLFHTQLPGKPSVTQHRLRLRQHNAN
jgi:hypothetical protein